MNLYKASGRGDINLVSKLLVTGHNPNIIPDPDARAWSSLQLAASKGYLKVVKALLAKGADINYRNACGETPLITAIKHGRNVVVNCLLGNGADPSIPEKNKTTPLVAAACSGNFHVAQMLLSMGARQSFEDIVRDIDNQSNLSWINRKEKVKIAFDNQPYLDQPLQVSLCKASSEGNIIAVKKLLGMGAAPNIPSVGCELTPLHHAALKGHLDVVKALLAKGAQVHSINHLNGTPLIFAVESGHNEVANFLLATGANPNITGENNMAPLHRAALTGNLDATKTLLASGANPELKDKYGRTAFECARVHQDKIREAILNQSDQSRSLVGFLCKASVDGDPDAVNMLLAKGADPNFFSNIGLSPLHCAALKGHTDVVKTLLVKGAHVNSQYHSGGTPLSLAVESFAFDFSNNNDDVINILLANGANPNIPDEFLRTPLHIAALYGNENAAKILLVNGANRDLKDMYGQTAFKCAKGVRKEEIQLAIQNHSLPSLKACARTCIRARLIECRTIVGQPLPAAIQALPLPTQMKTYLFKPLTL